MRQRNLTYPKVAPHFSASKPRKRMLPLKSTRSALNHHGPARGLPALPAQPQRKSRRGIPWIVQYLARGVSGYQVQYRILHKITHPLINFQSSVILQRGWFQNRTTRSRTALDEIIVMPPFSGPSPFAAVAYLSFENRPRGCENLVSCTVLGRPPTRR